MEKEGIVDLLRENRRHWSRFHLAEAYRLRLGRDPTASFNDFLVECGVRPSAFYDRCRRRCLVLWHATRRVHLPRVLEHGLFHHRGVFFAPPTFGLPVRLASGIPRAERGRPERLALLACLFDPSAYREGRDYVPGPSEVRFTSRVSPEAIFAVVTHESVECVGETLRVPDPITPARFLRRGGRWEAPTRQACRFGAGRSYRRPIEWLGHYLDRVLEGSAGVTFLELLHGIYMNVSPMEALPVADIVEHVCGGCDLTRPRGNHALLKKAVAVP